MAARELSSSELLELFPPGTVLHNPVTGEYARVVEHTTERVVGELLAVPGGAVAGPHVHPGQEERFEVVDGVMGYRLGDERGELRVGGAVTVAPGVVHDWWNAGEGDLRSSGHGDASGTVRRHDRSGLGSGRGGSQQPPRGCRSSSMPRCWQRPSANEIVFERPPRAVQRALAVTVAPIARRRGRSVTGDILRAAIVPDARWPA